MSKISTGKFPNSRELDHNKMRSLEKKERLKGEQRDGGESQRKTGRWQTRVSRKK